MLPGSPVKLVRVFVIPGGVGLEEGEALCLELLREPLLSRCPGLIVIQGEDERPRGGFLLELAEEPPGAAAAECHGPPALLLSGDSA